MEKESKSVGLKKEDAKNRVRWRVGVGEIAGRVGHPHLRGYNRIKTGLIMMIIMINLKKLCFKICILCISH